MSDKRITYAIGAIVAVFALVLGTVAGSTSLTTMSVSTDPMQISGHAIITLADSDGNIKAYRQTDNIVTDVGRNCAADKLFGVNTGTAICASGGEPGKFTFIGIGTGFTGSPELGDIELENEILTRTGALNSDIAAATTTGAIKIIKGTFILGTESTVNEVALFDSLAGGSDNMFSLLEISPVISGGLDDIITITYQVIVG